MASLDPSPLSTTNYLPPPSSVSPPPPATLPLPEPSPTHTQRAKVIKILSLVGLISGLIFGAIIIAQSLSVRQLASQTKQLIPTPTTNSIKEPSPTISPKTSVTPPQNITPLPDLIPLPSGLPWKTSPQNAYDTLDVLEGAPHPRYVLPGTTSVVSFTYPTLTALTQANPLSIYNTTITDHFTRLLNPSGDFGPAHFGSLTLYPPMADGPNGSVMGYISVNSNTLRSIAWGYDTSWSTFAADPEKINCPCTYTYTIFISEPVTLDQLLTFPTPTPFN